jgi:hypothetical protein
MLTESVNPVGPGQHSHGQALYHVHRATDERE